MEEHAALLHMRLSIIDIGGGAQPLKSHDGRFVGIVNGELYDYAHHRERLERRGVVFKTKSDSEVLLNLFACEGATSLAQISGEFAFVFFDTIEKCVHFGRDPHGVKPLFMKLTSDALSLASEAKALTEGNVEIDEVYLKCNLARLIAPPRTTIRHVSHVHPGRVYTWSLKTGQMDSSPYFQFQFHQQRILKGAEATERIRTELSAAVKRRLTADVEVGCYLSGGIDSALVAALMVENGARPKAFTVGFPKSGFDETDKAALIARHLGLEHHVIELTHKNFMAALRRSIVAFENPIANPHGAAKNILSHLAAQSVKVILSGEGADEWFGGYAYLRLHKLENFLKKHPRRKSETLRLFFEREAGVGLNHLDGSSKHYNDVLAKFFHGAPPVIFGRLLGTRSVAYLTGENANDFLSAAFRDLAGFLSLDADLEKIDDHDLNTLIALRTDFMHYILGNLGDRQEMSNSIEGRTPFLDMKLIAVVQQTAPSTFLKGLTEKSPLRAIASSILPPGSSKEKKHAFFAPMQYFFMRQNQEEIDAAVALARRHCSWLPWKNLDRVLTARKFPTNFARDLHMSLRMQLYSVGVLLSDLHVPQLPNPRGFSLPTAVQDILPYRISF